MAADPTLVGRRALLAGGLAALTAPGWIAAAFASDGPSTREKELFAAWHQARRDKRPLLVVVVPDEDDKWDRGRWIGAALNHASDDLLAALSGYQPACATVEELERLGVTVAGDPWFVVVEAAELPCRGTGIAGPGAPEVEETEDDVRMGTWSDALVDGWIDGVHQVLLASLSPRSGQAAVEAGRARWVPERLPGSHWALSGGCGVTIEDYEDNMRVGCGMGHVPAKARRMLYFFEPGTY